MNADTSRAPIADVVRSLAGVRSLARRLLVIRAVAVIVAWGAGTALVVGFLDYFLRMPLALRLVVWATGMVVLVEGVRRTVWPAAGFRPTLTEVALRLERTPQGRSAGLGGVLASGIELASDPDGSAAPLRTSVVREAVRKITTVHASRAVIAPGRAALGLALALGALAPIVALALFQPGLARVGAQRVLLPWTAAAWPKRTAVADVTSAAAHPLGSAVPLKAAITRTDKAPGRTDVWAMYRLITDAGGMADGVASTPRAGPIHRALLTGQERSVEDDTGAWGELYERLVEPVGLSLPSTIGDEPETAPPTGPTPTARPTPAHLALEYWFVTDDDQTQARQIRLVEPPAIVAASATVTLPEYAGAASGAGADLPVGKAAGARDLGDGRDDRSNLGPILAGSRIELVLNLNRALAAPANTPGTFPGAGLPSDLVLRADGAAWTLAWTAESSVRLPVMLKDEYGIASDRESVFQFAVVPDRPSSAAVIDPSQDESVLATAVLSLTGEARDDVGVAWAQLDYQVARAPSTSEGAPAEAPGPTTSLARYEPGRIAGTPGTNQRQARVTAELRLATLGLKPRDEVWLTALAQDIFASATAPHARHEPARSPVRRLRIIPEAELIAQIQNELSAVRQGALRLDQDQGDVVKKFGAGDQPSEVRPAQEGITQRLPPQAGIVRRLADRLKRNALEDRALSGLLEDAAGLIDDAADASARAGADLERLERPQSDPLAKAQQAESVAREQKAVRDELGRLIAMLDRGQDGWTARREVQRLLDEQRALQAATGELGRQTTGKAAQELPPQQRDLLEQIAQQQSDLSRRAQAAIEDLADRAARMQKTDAALAKAMEQASQHAQKAQIPDTQRQASEQVRQNQTSAASQSQQQAADALQEMLDDLDRTEQNRDEALRRTLEDIIQSLEALISQQESELGALGKLIGAGRLTGPHTLDAGMITLHGATLAVTEHVRSTFRELAPVADLLEGAARAQSTAVGLLRGVDPDGTEAEQAERISLDKLQQAKAEAQRLQKEAADKDQARKRTELRKAYRDALESQVALHGKTGAFLGKDLDRRQRAGVRALGEQQQTIRQSLADLRKGTAELAEARLFDFAHTRLDAAAGRAADTLREGSAGGTVDRDQRTAVRILQALVEALKEGKPGEFRKEAESGGDGSSGSGGGGGPLIPPLAELRLLRMMQQETADLTRSAGEVAGGAPDLVEEVGQLQDELAKRGLELIEKTNRRPDPDDAGEGDGKEPPTQPNFGFDGPQQPVRPPVGPAKPAEPKNEPPKDPLPTPPTLDELLGLPKSGEPGKAPDAQDPLKADLDRKLAPEEVGEQFQQAVQLMQQTAHRLRTAGDTGVTTQRLQEEIIRRLDQIIASAEQQQQQQSSASSSSSKSQQQRQQQPQSSQAQARDGENRGQVDPPGRQDGSGRTLQPGAGAAWGNLPEHVRDALVQGLSDRFSSMYQSLTEAYYKRLAEEPKADGTRKEPVR